MTAADGERRATFCSIFKTFDKSFLFIIACTNFALGFRRILELGLYVLFTAKFHLQPGKITALLGIMASPFVAKIFLAIITDNVAFWGSKRKSYFILNSAVCVICIFLMMGLGTTLG